MSTETRKRWQKTAALQGLREVQDKVADIQGLMSPAGLSPAPLGIRKAIESLERFLDKTVIKVKNIPITSNEKALDNKTQKV